MAHTFELTTIAAGREEHVPLLNEATDFKDIDNLISTMLGDSSKGTLTFFDGSKEVLPRKNTGFFGLSAAALSSELPVETFNAEGFNFGLLIDHTNSSNCKIHIASSHDCYSSVYYDTKKDTHRLNIYIGDHMDNKLIEALDKCPAATPYFDKENDLNYSFDERELGEPSNRVQYSVSDMMKNIKSQKWDRYKQDNGQFGWNEVLSTCNIKAVKGLFFSSDIDFHNSMVLVDFGIESHEIDLYKRNTQLVNAITAKEYIEKTFKIDLPIFEYDAQKGGQQKLSQIDINKEKLALLDWKEGVFIVDALKQIEEAAPGALESFIKTGTVPIHTQKKRGK